ncbi:DUF7507 domain-containing protein, partial [Nonlabens antarcticus]|uniref:DUF7507 domain-containing protein n=1 Tax=Nonlabens antarcticus TaxID=392714 RepID=UPI0018910DB3
ATLPPGPSGTDNTTFTGTYTIQQSDIDNSGVTNQATATGTTPNDGDITDLSGSSNALNDPTFTDFGDDNGIAVIKTGVFN